MLHSVVKFHDFTITQILREINSRDSRSAKFAILTHSEYLNFEILELLHFYEADVYQINSIQIPNCKRTSLVSKIDFT